MSSEHEISLHVSTRGLFRYTVRSPRCGHDDSDSNVRCAQICPHDVPHTLDTSDYLSIIEAQEDCMAQDIHLDSLEDGWSFLTAMECDQEVLILWNGYKYVCLLEPLIRDRQTACDHVRTKVQMEAAFTWTDEEWQSTIEPRVWTWLCQSQADKTFGSSPELKIKRVRIPKGWTIAVDSRTPHGGAPRVGPDALRLHIYAVVRAVDAVAAHADDLGDAAIQDATIDLRNSAYLPILHSAQRQHAAAFGRVH